MSGNVGAAVKLYQGAAQLFNAHGSLWGGDVTSFVSPVVAARLTAKFGRGAGGARRGRAG